MWIADRWEDYELLDCGGGERLERWDRQVLVRPDPQAIWETPREHPAWKKAGGGISVPPPGEGTGRKRPCRRAGRSGTGT